MTKSRNKPASVPRLPSLPSPGAWERAWQQHWSKVGLPGYELPTGGPGGDEREFLKRARTPDKERARLKRINDEFIRGFKGLFHVGPGVTVFGSARFKETHPYYKLARATGAQLAKAGFATLTGGGPASWKPPTAAPTRRVAPAMGWLARLIQQRFKLKSTLPRMGETIEL